jgi:hypothetical protein
MHAERLFSRAIFVLLLAKGELQQQLAVDRAVDAGRAFGQATIV